MGRNLRVLQVGEIYEVRYVGEVSYAYRSATLDEVASRLRESRIKKILIDFSAAWAAEDDPHGDAASFSEKVAAFAHARGARIALLSPPLEHARVLESMMAAMAFEIARFQERALALEWLAA